MHAILKHCYLFHRLSMPCPTLLHAQMQRNFLRSHNFKALMQKLSRKMSYLSLNCFQTVARNFFRSFWQCKWGFESPCAVAQRFQLDCRKYYLKYFLSFESDPCPKFQKLPVMFRASASVPVGGGSRRGISWTSIDSFAKSVPKTFDVRSTLLYAAHVANDEVSLKKYPSHENVYAVIPLISMVDILTLANVRAIAALHGIDVSS